MQIENVIFKHYEGGWPVRDMIRQYLRNRSARERQILNVSLAYTLDEYIVDSDRVF